MYLQKVVSRKTPLNCEKTYFKYVKVPLLIFFSREKKNLPLTMIQDPRDHNQCA
jgi:hypothetical protein